MSERILVPVFNANELNALDNRCKPNGHDEIQCIDYLKGLNLYSVSVYSVLNKLSYEGGSIICTLSSNDIYNPDVSFDEFYLKNGHKYNNFDRLKKLYLSYHANVNLQKMYKDVGFRRNISLLKLEIQA